MNLIYEYFVDLFYSLKSLFITYFITNYYLKNLYLIIKVIYIDVQNMNQYYGITSHSEERVMVL